MLDQSTFRGNVYVQIYVCMILGIGESSIGQQGVVSQPFQQDIIPEVSRLSGPAHLFGAHDNWPIKTLADRRGRWYCGRKDALAKERERANRVLARVTCHPIIIRYRRHSGSPTYFQATKRSTYRTFNVKSNQTATRRIFNNFSNSQPSKVSETNMRIDVFFLIFRADKHYVVFPFWQKFYFWIDV